MMADGMEPEDMGHPDCEVCQEARDRVNRRREWVEKNLSITVGEDGHLVAFIVLREATDEEVEKIGVVTDMCEVAKLIDSGRLASHKIPGT